MDDTNDNRHLHLQRVGEDQSVLGSVPRRIDTEGVPSGGLDAFDNGALLKVGGPAELRLGESEREGEDIVVHESGEDGEELLIGTEVSARNQLSRR